MCIKGVMGVQELLLLVGLMANGEHCSHVTVLLCKCEKITPVVYPAAGQRKGQGSQTATNGERKQSLGFGRQVPKIRCSPGAEIRVSIFVLWFLTAAGRGRRSRLRCLRDINTPLMRGSRVQIGCGRVPPPFKQFQFKEIKHKSCRNASLY